MLSVGASKEFLSLHEENLVGLEEIYREVKLCDATMQLSSSH